jgi:hypothetical protein
VVVVVLLTGGGGGGAGAGVGVDGSCFAVVLTLLLSKSGFICACMELMANSASVERNIIFRILVCFKGIKMIIICKGALPEKQEILKIYTPVIPFSQRQYRLPIILLRL